MKEILETEDIDIFKQFINNRNIKIYDYKIIPTIATSNYNTKGNYEHQYTKLKYIIIYGPKNKRFTYLTNHN